jgi:hypothetical protein
MTHLIHPAPTGRSKCRGCGNRIAAGELRIEKGAWRISLVFYEDGRFEPSGFIHVPCAQDYFETIEVLPRLKHFSPDLSDDDLGELAQELQRSAR